MENNVNVAHIYLIYKQVTNNINNNTVHMVTSYSVNIVYTVCSLPSSLNFIRFGTISVSVSGSKRIVPSNSYNNLCTRSFISCKHKQLLKTTKYIVHLHNLSRNV